MKRLASDLPLALFYPFRLLAVRLPRGNPVRSAAILVLKWASRGNRAWARRVVVPLDMPEISFTPADSMVLEALYWYGLQGYEGCVASVWQALCARSTNVLEVGGNVGLFAVIGGRAARGAYTVVEPVPEVAAILRGNLRRNGVDRVVVLEGAVIPQDEACEVTLNVPDEGREAPVGAHLTVGVEVTGRTTAKTLVVAGLPFRDLLAGRDLIKIDAEGIEYQLLNSSRATIAEVKPTLLIEVLPEAVQLGALIADLARTAGYRLYVLPEYRLNKPVMVDPATFSSKTPEQHFAKDVVLTLAPLPGV